MKSFKKLNKITIYGLLAFFPFYSIGLEKTAGENNMGAYTGTITHPNGVIIYVNDKIFTQESPANNTSLNTAIKERSIEEFQRLIKNGADIEERDSLGNRPLHYAVMYRFFPAVKTLIKKGANMSATNNQEITALEMTHINFKEKIQLLHELQTEKILDSFIYDSIQDQIERLKKDEIETRAFTLKEQQRQARQGSKIPFAIASFYNSACLNSF